MSLCLRPGLSWCLNGGRCVFLDLDQDRYFCLPDEAVEALFRQWVAGELCDPAGLRRLVSSGLLQPGEGPRREPPTIGLPTADFGAEVSADIAAADVLVAAFGQIKAWAELRLRSVAALVAGLPAKLPAGRDTRGDGEARRVAQAFRRAGMLVRSADQCLPRALAAHRLCGRRGIAAQLVFGVRLNPFAAHCWVQAGDAVIVGDLEQVRLFTPILVVP